MYYGGPLVKKYCLKYITYVTIKYIKKTRVPRGKTWWKLLNILSTYFYTKWFCAVEFSIAGDLWNFVKVVDHADVRGNTSTL